VPGSFPDCLKRQRARVGLKQVALAMRMGVHEITVSRWERGKTWPTLRQQVLLCQELKVTPEALGLADPAPGTAPADRLETPGQVATATMLDADGAALWPVATDDEDDDVERRALLKLIGGTLALPLTGRLEDLRRSVDHALNAVPTSQETDEWERLAFEYSHQVRILPPAHYLPDLLADLGEVQDRLAISPDGLRPRLVRLCGQLSALTAISLLDVGDARSAARYWRTALRAVDQVDDRSLRALVRGRRAVFALYGHRAAGSVLALADDAINVADGAPCAGVAEGYGARAQALAQLGQHGEARDALHDLSDVFVRLPDPVRADRVSTWGWAEQRLRHVESWVHSYAGRLGDATTAHDAALALYPPTVVLQAAQVELHRATCLIVSGDPSEGARHTIRTLEALPTEHRRNALLHRTATLALDRVPDSALHLPPVAEARGRLALPSRRS
jgi:transcriptional regulator with XRE-family HTH domain